MLKHLKMRQRILLFIFAVMTVLPFKQSFGAEFRCAEVFLLDGVTLAQSKLWQKLKTYPEFRRARKEFKATAKNSVEQANEYQAFFAAVEKNQSLLTPKRFLSLMDNLSPIEGDVNLSVYFLDRVREITSKNQFELYKLMPVVLSRFSRDYLIKDLEQNQIILPRLQKIGEDQNPEAHSYFLVVPYVVKAAAQYKGQHEYIKTLELLRLGAAKYSDFSYSDLVDLTAGIFNVIRYNGEFRRSFVLDSLRKGWGNRRFSYPEFDLQRALQEFDTVTSESLYTKDRSLFGDKSYESGFLSSFKSALMSLKSDQVWLDSGAGKFGPIVQYYSNGGQARTIGVTIEASSKEANIVYLQKKYPQKFTALLGKPTESYSAAELPKVDLITDFYGAFSYSPHVDKVMQHYLTVLNTGGRIDMYYSNQYNRVQVNGVRLELLDWISTIQGISYRAVHIPGGAVAITIIKQNDKVSVPPLVLADYKNDLPASRRYRIPTYGEL